MDQAIKYPFDLAEIVEKQLKLRRIQPPTKEILAQIFEIIYFASLKTEELQQILCSLTYIDSDNPDPKPPERIVANRWSYVRFKKEPDFDIKNIVKLSKAANPYSTSIAIHCKDNKLVIWGMIDQAHSYNNFINFESNEGPERPGLFQISITGIGAISIYSKYSLIAELRQGFLINEYHNVFHTGPISKMLCEYAKDYFKSVVKSAGMKIFERRDQWVTLSIHNWLNTIRRILLDIQRYKHGGALLITPDNSLEDLNIKYQINYTRLSELLQENQKNAIDKCFFEDFIIENYLDKKKKEIPVDFYLKEKVCGNDEADTNEGIAGSVRFISSLSCVDGLVLMDQRLNVKGFGVVIEGNSTLNNVFIANDSLATTELLKPIRADIFGTRHRSMMHYCLKHEGSIGFVVSQDGDIRVMTKLNDKLVIWENIMIQLQIKEKE
jgi:hypothetical protein